MWRVPPLLDTFGSSVRSQVVANVANWNGCLRCAVAMFADVSCFGDDAGAMGADDSDEDVDGAAELVLPVGEASQAGPRRISLSSLWSGSSGISLPEEDDPSICHRASSSASSAQGSAMSSSGVVIGQLLELCRMWRS